MARIIDDSKGGIGSTTHAFLTEAQFQALHGTGWVLCDGRNVSGSAYSNLFLQANVPDARGVVLRGLDNGAGRNPDAGVLSLGSFQDHALFSHQHDMSHTHSASNVSGAINFTGYSPLTNGPPNSYPEMGFNGFNGTTFPVNFNLTAGGQTHSGYTQPTGIPGETRMRNVSANIFIRIN